MFALPAFDLQILDLDIQRQGVREAARAIQKQQKGATCCMHVWITLPGAVPMHMVRHEALQWLDAGVCIYTVLTVAYHYIAAVFDN